MPRLRFTIRDMVFVILIVAIALSLSFTSIGPNLGFVLCSFLVYSGLLQTRIGMECAWVLLHTIGVSGWNSSGRQGDDPMVGWEYFPWLLLSTGTLLVAMLTIIAAAMISLKDRKRTARESSKR
jgi:predicted outer membrane lipoprotein